MSDLGEVDRPETIIGGTQAVFAVGPGAVGISIAVAAKNVWPHTYREAVRTGTRA